MGLTHVEALVTGPNGESRSIRLLVDSGATYSVLPADVWPELGLKPRRTIAFSLADGTQISRGVSECRFALEGADAHSPVVLGEPGDEPLLGTVTLETLGLMLDPLKRTLQPMRMLLA